MPQKSGFIPSLLGFYEVLISYLFVGKERKISSNIGDITAIILTRPNKKSCMAEFRSQNIKPSV